MASWRDYAQLMKVRIAGLLLLVALAGYVATSGPAIDWGRLGWLVVAGFLASTGSSVVNSYVDRDIDPPMGRTPHPAPPLGRIPPPPKVLGVGTAPTPAPPAGPRLLATPPPAGVLSPR